MISKDAAGDTASRSFGFVAAAIAFVAVFASAATPIPIYGLYRTESGLTNADFSLTAAGYFAGAVTGLLMLGRLSNHFGRRPIILLSLALSAAGGMILLHVSSAASLILGRMLQGLACGVASSATAASVIDNAPARPAWLAPVLSSTSPMIGLSIGALVSGLLVETAPMPRMVPYLTVFAVLALCAVLILSCRETVARRPGAVRSLWPTFRLPEAGRSLFPVACCIFVATWALGGFYQAFGPSMASEQLGSTNALVSAAVFSAFIAPGAVGGPLAGRLSPAGAQRLGMVVFTLGVAGILASLRAAAIWPFLAASVVAGAAQGAVLTGSVRGLLGGAKPLERAGTFSLIYATSYVGAAVPSFIAGQLSRSFGTIEIASGYGVLAMAACIVTLAAARNPVGPVE